MIFLLDTHYLLWSLTEPKKIPAKIRPVITSTDNLIFVSAISFWEISLKSSLGKLQLTGFAPEDLKDACLEAGFSIIPLTDDDSSSYHKLTTVYHRDPFDRMLIWQAIRNDYVFISADETVRKYTAAGLKILK